MASGIKRILIGTGHLSTYYESLMSIYPEVECINSDKYETTSSMYTLYNMRDKIEDDFLLFESDLLYEYSALNNILTDGYPNIILASGFTQSGDEVFIQTSKDGKLVNLSKSKAYLESLDAEFVGISKISKSSFDLMVSYFQEIKDLTPKIDYEHVIVEVSKIKPFKVKKIDSLVWCEIDDETHLERAITRVLPKIKAKDSVTIKRNILLNPGPATTTDTVKLAQIVPDICPREKEFGDVMKFISDELTSFVANNDDYTTVLFGGSGTAVVESVITSVVPHDKKILIINNGSYGQRMCQIATTFGVKHIDFKSSTTKPIDFDLLTKAILSDDEISHIAVVHNETTTGLLNNLKSLGDLCKKYNKELIVDAMSSFAAVPINMVSENISFLIASSNKNIQSVAGVGFIIANKNSLNKLKDVKSRSFYLDLYSQYTYFVQNHQLRFTPPVQIMYALKQAIIEAKEETIEKRYERYSKSWETLISGLDRLGLKYLVDKNNHSRIITSIVNPDVKGFDFDEMHDYFMEKGFTIYPGKLGEINTFRIANIGEIDYTDISNFLVHLETYLTSLK